MKWQSSLQLRLSLGFGLVMGGVCTLLIGYFARVTRTESMATAREVLLSSVRREAGILDSQMNKAMDVSRVLAQTLGALAERPGGASRDEAHAIMRRILERHSEFLDIFTLWEPDAFDGHDARYAGKPLHDATGRFIPVWNRAGDGTLRCEAALGYETPGLGDYYLLPRRSLRECVIEPYAYPLRGEEIFMTSLVVPILRDGQFRGLAGVDYRLEYLQHLADQVHLYDGTARLYFLSQAGVVAGATAQPHLVGHPRDAQLAAAIGSSRERESLLTSQGLLCATTTVQVGSAAEPWRVILTVPVKAVTAVADRRIALLVVGASAFCLLGILATLALVRLQVVGRVQRLTEATEAVARGDYGTEIHIPGPDELRRLAEAFNAMTRHIAASLKAVQDSEALRVNAIDGSLQFYSLLSMDGNLEFANRTALDQIDASLEAVVGRPFWTLDWWTHDEAVQAQVRQGIETARDGGVFRGEVSFRARGGAIRITDLSVSPLRDSNGTITHLLSEGRDITDELRTKRALEVSEARYRQIVEDSPIGVFRVRVDGAFEFANQVTLRQFDCKTLEELNAHYGHPETRWPSLGAYHDYVARLKASGRVMGQEVGIRLVDGRPRFHALYCYLDPGKELISGFLVDITEQKHLAEQLNQSQKLEAVGQLASGVAHDFNNILAGILGAAEVLRRDLGGDPSRERLFNLIISAAERAGRLTHKLLAFSRKAPKVSSPVNVETLVKDATEILERTLDKAVQIRIVAEPGTAWVTGDDAMLLNAFLNLGINAGHAMPEGGTLTFHLGNRDLDAAACAQSTFPLEPGPHVEVTVQDTGTGIPPEFLDRIFEPFFTTKEQGEGTGLGLFAVYGTIRDHRGAISVESRVGGGTTFRILLPLAPAVKKAPAEGAWDAQGTGTILLIDDEEIIRVSATAMLERQGYQVLTAENGSEGLARFREAAGGIDLIILDVIMPVMGGRTALQQIRELDPRVPVIMCSGFSKKDDLANLHALGISAFLHKPFRSLELAEAVAAALKAARKPEA